MPLRTAALAKIAGMGPTGRLKDPPVIGVRVGKVIKKRKVARHVARRHRRGILQLAPRPGQQRRRRR
jgi:hypothetical protein